MGSERPPNRLLRELRPAVLAAGPITAAALTLAAGVMLLASGATPSVPGRFVHLLQVVPVLLVEASHFISSVLGLVLVLLAFGLRARLGAAWVATLAVVLIATPVALLKGFNWEESAALLALAIILAGLGAAFPRKARLSQMEITPGWLFSAFAVLVGAGLLGVWSFMNADYTDQPFWKVMADADAARALRSSVGAAVALFAVGLWRMFATPATPHVVGEDDPAFDRVRAILAKAQASEPGANLALLGDKRFFFSGSGESFLMFGVRGRSWIALGAPVGRRDERLELLWKFREQADAHAARPGVYGVGPDDLPDLIDLGFAIQKVGETAVVPLAVFSMEGSRRGNIRRSWRKAGEGGATFEVVEPDRVAGLLPQLQRVSDAWLEEHSGSEKTFSLGSFIPGYVSEFPIAVVWADGKVVAFATLWTTAERGAFSMDLMRYAPEAPKNVMDYLFVELIAWGKAAGYVAFEFGMAPLAGLDDRPLAPVLSRVGRLLFERAEDLYNFQGVRRFKDKYDPVWQPRYIAAPHGWTLPFLMADVGLLSSGGMAGLTRRPKREEALSGRSTAPSGSPDAPASSARTPPKAA